MRRRAQEITADRAGLICCQSLSVAISAVIKIMSGLDEKHLNLKIDVILDEFKNINPSLIPEEEMYSTHPPLPIRIRALLWFSMSQPYYASIKKNVFFG